MAHIAARPSFAITASGHLFKLRPLRGMQAGIAAMLFSTSAFAADLPSRPEAVSPVVQIAPLSWTGVYVGGSLGWIRTNSEYTTGATLLGQPFMVASTADKGGLSYGGLAGVNYQGGQMVLGVEGDLTGWTTGEVR